MKYRYLILLSVCTMQAMDVEVQSPKLADTIEQLVHQPRSFEKRWGQLPGRALARIVYFLMKDHPIIELYETEEAREAHCAIEQLKERPRKRNQSSISSSGDVRLLCFSPDNRWLLVINDDARVWYSTGSYWYPLGGSISAITAAQFSPNGKLFTGSKDGTVRQWRRHEGQVVYSHTQEVTCMSCSPDNSYLITGSDDATAKVWSIKQGRILYTLQHAGALTSVAWKPHSAVVAMATHNGGVMLLDVVTGNTMYDQSYESPVRSVKWDALGKRLLVVTTDRVMVIEDLKEIFSSKCSPVAAHFDSRGERVIVTSTYNTVTVFQISSKEIATGFISKAFLENGERNARFVGRDDAILHMPDDNQVLVCDAVSNKPLVHVRYERPITTYSLNSACTRLAVASRNQAHLIDVGDIAYYFMHELTLREAVLIIALERCINRSTKEKVRVYLPVHLKNYFDLLRSDVKKVLEKYLDVREKSPCVIL